MLLMLISSFILRITYALGGPRTSKVAFWFLFMSLLLSHPAAESSKVSAEAVADGNSSSHGDFQCITNILQRFNGNQIQISSMFKLSPSISIYLHLQFLPVFFQ